jgi:hypothetical protein
LEAEEKVPVREERVSTRMSSVLLGFNEADKTSKFSIG